MRALVLGATGSVGRLTVDQALARGHQITALVRDPAKLEAAATRVTAIRGDALDDASVAHAVTGQDAVVYLLGAGNVRRTSLFSDSTRILLKAMTEHGVHRLICVTGVGAGDTKGHGGFLYDGIVYPLFTKNLYADKDLQESLIQESALEWTIVRPAPYRTKRPAGPIRVATKVEGVTLRKISREEVAEFLVDELEQHRFIRQAVFIGHE